MRETPVATIILLLQHLGVGAPDDSLLTCYNDNYVSRESPGTVVTALRPIIATSKDEGHPCWQAAGADSCEWQQRGTAFFTRRIELCDLYLFLACFL
jgi:hypothetical protein